MRVEEPHHPRLHRPASLAARPASIASACAASPASNRVSACACTAAARTGCSRYSTSPAAASTPSTWVAQRLTVSPSTLSASPRSPASTTLSSCHCLARSPTSSVMNVNRATSRISASRSAVTVSSAARVTGAGGCSLIVSPPRSSQPLRPCHRGLLLPRAEHPWPTARGLLPRRHLRLHLSHRVLTSRLVTISPAGVIPGGVPGGGPIAVPSPIPPALHPAAPAPAPALARWGHRRVRRRV